ncbi:hypothetical protein IKX73_01325, partial [Candidatus Saccharibacteria bacterium]|nr:hypothetical protein [Candidatus Saccharibacteria bacterium]
VINATTNHDGTAATGYTGTSSTNFTIGAKASADQAAGDYTNVITFTAVTNEVPAYMQSFTASECQSLASDANYTVYDARDGSDYTVRYIEGACWMTQNLRITGTVSSNESNFSTYNSVNVCEEDIINGGSLDTPQCHDSGNDTYGVWYNYAAASAKTIIGSSDDTLATEDICPANWHLPSYIIANNTAGSIGSLVSTMSTSLPKFSPVAGGVYHYDGQLAYTNTGSWWTSAVIVNGSMAHYLNYDSSTGVIDNSGHYRDDAHYIRCVRL